MRLTPAITSRTNTRVKALRASLSGEARRPGDLLGLEGSKLIGEAHMAGMSFETIYLREGSEADFLDWGKPLRTREWAVLSRDVFDGAVSTATPQGVAATWTIGENSGRLVATSPVLVLENVQDPGNLGTLIRSALAFGAAQVFVTPETVNHWNPKVVRSAAGALFRVEVRRMPLQTIFETLRASGARLFAAVSEFLSGPEDGCAWMAARHGVMTGRINNEDAPEDLQYPMAPGAAEVAMRERYDASLSYDTDFLEPCALLIGNEAAGLSQEARRMADEQVLIPCSAESLNAAVAGSVLMYEVMRQRDLRTWARKHGLRP